MLYVKNYKSWLSPKLMSLSATISGIVLVFLGVVFLGISIINASEIAFALSFVIYGLIALGLGTYMLANQKKEDKIEQIKTNKNPARFVRK